MKILLAGVGLLLLTLSAARAADDALAPTAGEPVPGAVVGVGIGVKMVDHQPVVDQVIPGNSAYQHGMKVGDRLLRINGQSVQGLSLGQIAGMLRGASNTRVKLVVQRPGEESPRSFGLTRQIVTLINPIATKPPLAP